MSWPPWIGWLHFLCLGSLFQKSDDFNPFNFVTSSLQTTTPVDGTTTEGTQTEGTTTGGTLTEGTIGRIATIPGQGTN